MEQPKIDGTDHQAAPDMSVLVQTDDFADAVRSDQHNCALVWAIRRKFPEARRVRVNTEHVTFARGETRYVYPTTEQIKEKVIKPLDTGGDCDPVTVKLTGGWTKPVIRREAPKMTARERLDAERRRNARVKRGEITPSSAGYNRLRVVKTDG